MPHETHAEQIARAAAWAAQRREMQRENREELARIKVLIARLEMRNEHFQLDELDIANIRDHFTHLRLWRNIG